MGDRGDGFCLALESRAPVGIDRKTLGKNLDRDVTVEPRIAGAVDLAHAAGPNGGLDFVRAEPGSRTE